MAYCEPMPTIFTVIAGLDPAIQYKIDLFPHSSLRSEAIFAALYVITRLDRVIQCKIDL